MNLDWATKKGRKIDHNLGRTILSYTGYTVFFDMGASLNGGTGYHLNRVFLPLVPPNHPFE